MSIFRYRSRSAEGDEWIAEKRARELRWKAQGAAVVEHPAHGRVCVPCGSPLAAIRCAAEYWDCEVKELYDASVMAWQPGDGPVEIPAEFAARRTG